MKKIEKDLGILRSGKNYSDIKKEYYMSIRKKYDGKYSYYNYIINVDNKESLDNMSEYLIKKFSYCDEIDIRVSKYGIVLYGRYISSCNNYGVLYPSLQKIRNIDLINKKNDREIKIKKLLEKI